MSSTMSDVMKAKLEEESQPTMLHLLGFWDPENWADDKWDRFGPRQEARSWLRRWSDQYWHRWMGRVSRVPGIRRLFWSAEWWEARETGQWGHTFPDIGSYDHCMDHYHWLLGAGQRGEAELLRANAQKRRAEFLRDRLT